MKRSLLRRDYCPLTGTYKTHVPPTCESMWGIFIRGHHFVNVWVNIACDTSEGSQEGRGQTSSGTAGSFGVFEDE